MRGMPLISAEGAVWSCQCCYRAEGDKASCSKVLLYTVVLPTASFRRISNPISYHSGEKRWKSSFNTELSCLLEFLDAYRWAVCVESLRVTCRWWPKDNKRDVGQVSGTGKHWPFLALPAVSSCAKMVLEDKRQASERVWDQWVAQENEYLTAPNEHKEVYEVRWQSRSWPKACVEIVDGRCVFSKRT